VPPAPPHGARGAREAPHPATGAGPPLLFLVRHGETVWNRAGRLQGRADSPLSEQGVAHARAYGRLLGEALRAAGGAVSLHVSPLGRARRTAALLAETAGLGDVPVRVDARLAEHDVGEWAGLSWDQIEQRHGLTREVLRDWHFRPPGGETRAEMLARAAEWLADHGGGGVHVVVSHGGFSRAFRAAFLGLRPDAAAGLPAHLHGRLFRLGDGAVHALEAGPAPAGDERLLG